MNRQLDSLTIRGFKSIKLLKAFQPGALCVLIGANGAGKSNFVDFFRMLRAMTIEGLQVFVKEQGGADSFLYLGPKVTRAISCHLEFGDNTYEFKLTPTTRNELQLAEEKVKYTGGRGLGGMRTIARGKWESALRSLRDENAHTTLGPGVPYYVFESLSNWVVYHFHDSSDSSLMRRAQSVQDRDRLRDDASNIAAFLLDLSKTVPATYELIRDTIRMMIPFFDDFLLRPEESRGEKTVRLEWRQKGSDYPFQPSHLSDGSIRFICLATALLQPDPPAMIVIDEPELGLHPYAVGMLADLVKSASKQSQVIVATQSPTLLDHFAPEDIVVVSRKDSGSEFDRLNSDDLKDWLDDYSVGELWQKDVVRGGPRCE